MIDAKFCSFCLVNLDLIEENKVLHEMRCVKRHKGIALNQYQLDRLLKELLNNAFLNTGDWYNDVINKLVIAKYGTANYDFDKIREELKNV